MFHLNLKYDHNCIGGKGAKDQIHYQIISVFMVNYGISNTIVLEIP